MYKGLYNWMVPRIGAKAAKAGLRLQYSYVLVAVVGFTCLAITWAGAGRSTLLWTALGVPILLAVAVGVYARIQFAAALSEYFNTKVRWYRLPFLTQPRLFNKWLEDIEKDPSSKS